MDVPVKFGDSRSNRSQDIRAAHFVMDERRMTLANGPPRAFTREMGHAICGQGLSSTGRRLKNFCQKFKLMLMQQTACWHLFGVQPVSMEVLSVSHTKTECLHMSFWKSFKGRRLVYRGLLEFVLWKNHHQHLPFTSGLSSAALQHTYTSQISWSWNQWP